MILTFALLHWNSNEQTKAARSNYGPAEQFCTSLVDHKQRQPWRADGRESRVETDSK